MKKTKSYTYAYPMIVDFIQFKPQIINVFLGDKKHPSIKGNLFVLYKFIGTKDFIKYEESVKTNSLYVTSYDPDKQHVMMVFNIPDKYKLDFFHYKLSQYSKMSDKYKKKILATHNLDNTHILYHILYKTEHAYSILEQAIGSPIPRVNEATSILNMDDEVYSTKYYQLPSISPNKDFYSGKPLIITPKEGPE